ncbi:hypothetical protein AJ80_08585 [Polytolypa hystricis UAMH7299]|uniref:DNA replication checkpoint mediator MRC1 domain-containing protein n=1 Tax=Polytolypa hystricis (strain UAMH7299) TaxID=1447883 RepID=A0A2B7X5R0_POLH7|nr:hypothetical protein AJ80_08585 [Polytolypa hystricis UAMH7299]
MSSASSPPRCSTRHSSPANGDNNGEQDMHILTPRRKVAALLRAWDDSEEESDKDGESGRKNLFTAGGKLDVLRDHEHDHEEEDEEEEEEEEEEEVRPRGGLAARMRAAAAGNAGIDASSSASGERSVVGTATSSKNMMSSAYERVSKQLAQAETQEGEGESVTKDNNTMPREGSDTSENDDDDDDALPLAPKRRTTMTMSASLSRAGSPLFVPADSPSTTTRRRRGDSLDGNEDNTAPSSPQNARLLALVAQKRREREERERLEAEKKARLQQQHRSSDMAGIDMTSDEDTDGEGVGKKLTQQSSRPTARKASKKALVEMNRETQRMSRNMQLAHQAVVKKKVTLQSFLDRFNMGSKNKVLGGVERKGEVQLESSPTASEEEVGVEMQSTPPTSPPQENSPATKGSEGVGSGKVPDYQADAFLEDDEELPSIDDLLAAPVTVTQPQPVPSPKAMTSPAATKQQPRKSRTIRVRLSRQTVAQQQQDSSDELEVITSPSKTRRFALFENLPARRREDGSSSFLKLRTLAQLNSPTREKQRNKGGLTCTELEAELFAKARAQAAREKAEKLDELRARGVVVESAEDRARVEEEVEDLMEKARREGDEIRRKERKKEGKKDEEGDSDDEEEYRELELSGSDEEGDDEGEDDIEEEEEGGEEEDVNRLIDDKAGEDSGPEEASDEEAEIDTAEDPDTTIPRRRRTNHVISDDEDEDEDNQPTTNPPQATNIPTQQTPAKPQIPNLGISNPVTPLMGLTQAFAATLADSQSDEEQDSLEILRKMPACEIPVSDLLEINSPQIVPDSQSHDSGPQLDLFSTQRSTTSAVARVSESPAGMRYSQIPEPTQDAGFVYSPFDMGKRFMSIEPMAPASTVDTVPLAGVEESPVVQRQRQGRLLRRGDMGRGNQADEEDEEFLMKASAFDVMRKATKKKTVFDKKTSKAAEVIDEAAEESEDEYAGLGGASDESAGEEDEFDRRMIDDESGEMVDEKMLAKLNADHSRLRDEEAVQKLLRDINTGALRRKRGAADDLDLSDSDDERIAARRRAKRREFAKMRKALLAADERIGVIAEDPKKMAFLRSIEDREEFDDERLDMDDEASTVKDVVMVPASQEEHDNNPTVNDNNTTTTAAANDNNSKKRKRPPLDPSNPTSLNRPPPHLRRNPLGTGAKKPSTLAEIRESVSFLLEGPESNFSTTPTPGSSDSEAEGEAEGEGENSDDELAAPPPPGLTRETSHTSETGNGNVVGKEMSTNPRRRGQVVDRLSLRRAASSNASSSSLSSFMGSSGTGKFAFAADNSVTGSGPFKRPGPPLLRRATTNSSMSSSSSGSGSGSGSLSQKGAVPGTRMGTGVGGSFTAAPKSVVGMQSMGVSGRRGAVTFSNTGGTSVKGGRKEEEKRKKKDERGIMARDGGVGLGNLVGGGSWE